MISFLKLVFVLFSDNLEFHLDGKIPQKSDSKDSKAVTRSIASQQQIRTRSSLSQNAGSENDNRISFADMYGRENLSGEFIANVSRLPISTQLQILHKNKLLQKESMIESVCNAYRATLPVGTLANGASKTVAKELALTENSVGSTDSAEGVEGGTSKSDEYLC